MKKKMTKTNREAMPAEEKPKSFAKIVLSVLLTLTLTILAGGMIDVIAQDQADKLKLIPEEGPSKNLPERCSLKPDGGPCKALFEKYYFDGETGKCQTFFYGGCDGTVPFETMDECEKECMDKLSEKGAAPADEPGQVTGSGRPPLDYTGFIADAMVDAIAKQEFEEYRFRDFFIFDKPKGWEMDTDEGYFRVSPDKKRIYGITLTAPVHDMVEISIRYYDEGNLLDGSEEKYIRAHADLSLNDTQDSGSDTVLEEVEISGRKAFKFNGSPPVHIREESEPDNSIMSKRTSPEMTVEASQQYVAFLTENGYYALSYRALPNIEKLFQPVFDRIVDSFKPLK